MDMGEINQTEIGMNMPDQQPQQLKQSSSDKSNNNRHKEGECTSKMADGKLMQSYECNICLDVAKDAVVSFCGHLFCWPCLHQWFCKCRPKMPHCPVCRTAISEDKVVPIYGHGDNNAAAMDQRADEKKIPPRPPGPMGNRNESVQMCINSLMHACTCTDPDCRRGTCRKMKKVISHSKQCRKRLQENAECALCKQLLALLCYHARNCAEHKCKVPFCPQIKQKLATQ